jgi:hypothetical protein
MDTRSDLERWREFLRWYEPGRSQETQQDKGIAISLFDLDGTLILFLFTTEGQYIGTHVGGRHHARRTGKPSRASRQGAALRQIGS